MITRKWLGLCLSACALLIFSPFSFAEVRLPAIFGDHMVLQGGGSASIWGVADPGEEVSVVAGSSIGKAAAGSNGSWKIDLSDLKASPTPIEVTVRGKNTIILQDVLVGDVWICSGQSNMNFGIKLESSATVEIPRADHPLIRLFMVPQRVSAVPRDDLEPQGPHSTRAHWLVCTPENLVMNGWGGFSAVGYYFGRDIQKFTGQPVGLIETTFSGTPAEAWTSLEALQRVPALKTYADAGAEFDRNYDALLQKYNESLALWQVDFDRWKTDHKQDWESYQAQLAEWQKNPVGPAPKHPLPRPAGSPDTLWNTSSVLYNGMIAPLIPYGIKGVIWYQGEGNATSRQRALDYGTLLPTMIADWRMRWGQGDFPFLIVQLASWGPPANNSVHGNFPYVREAQMKTLSQPNIGLATAIDIGEPGDIHPKDKLDVGTRLALVARRIAYEDHVVDSGPVFKGLKVEGNKVRVTFDDFGEGLKIGSPPAGFHPGQPRAVLDILNGFEVAGSDGIYSAATSLIEGKAVVLSNDGVPEPVSVRYNWGDVGNGNLYNGNGLPALPFRTESR